MGEAGWPRDATTVDITSYEATWYFYFDHSPIVSDPMLFGSAVDTGSVASSNMQTP